MAQATEQTQQREAIERYNDAWNAHDLDAIIAMHAPDMVFENHTAGERAEGPQVREHIAHIFKAWPDIGSRTRRLYVRDHLQASRESGAARCSFPRKASIWP
jgi:ketosteroid isomerase-like protein